LHSWQGRHILQHLKIPHPHLQQPIPTLVLSKEKIKVKMVLYEEKKKVKS
jgi:hypothetical protein